jgi:hypothetical protein
VVGLQVPETLLDKSFFRIGQRLVIQPLMLVQSGEGHVAAGVFGGSAAGECAGT